MLIQQFYDLNIFIDNLNIFEAPGVVFIGARILESINDPIPRCSLILSVPLGWINQRSIVDGTELRFDIKSTRYEISESLYFRLVDITEISVEQQFCKVALSGALDFYPGYRYLNAYNLYGTSSDVFMQVAKDFKLNSDIDVTNDEQLWVSGTDNLYKHLNKIAKHGWINETSAMFWAFDRKKTLLYKNLTDLFRTRNQKTWTFVQRGEVYDSTEKLYGYSNAALSIASGTENLFHEGYGGDDKYFDLASYQWKYPAARKVVAESNLINISKELSQGLATNWYPFDVGNFHENYHLARKQNARILSTYSTYAALECAYFMNYRLGQIVKFILMDSQDINNSVKMGSGIYIITGITIHMTNHEITSAVQLAMQGINGQAITRETY